jgi:hypothetical protein
MGCASRKTLANFWKGLRVVVLAAADVAADVDVAAADAIVESAVVVVVLLLVWWWMRLSREDGCLDDDDCDGEIVVQHRTIADIYLRSKR